MYAFFSIPAMVFSFMPRPFSFIAVGIGALMVTSYLLAIIILLSKSGGKLSAIITNVSKFSDKFGSAPSRKKSAAEKASLAAFVCHAVAHLP